MSMLALTLIAPILIKTNSAGFAPLPYARSEKCEVFQTHVLMTRTYGLRSIEYNFPMKAGDVIHELVEEASQEQFALEDNYMCDAPATTVKARLQKDGVEKDILIYSTGGCGAPKKYRQGPASYSLMDIASTFCPKTH
ncbi:MAG: hypothetical protein ACLGHN_08795 [Bacteriovoracia bacterium]